MRRRLPAGARRTIAARRAPAARPGPLARKKGDRSGAWAAALLALAVLAWLLWPAAAPSPAAPQPPAPAAKVETRKEPRKVAARRPPPPAPPAQSGLDEARVRAAVLARAASLRACAVPAGAPSQVPVRLRVPASGEVRSVQIGGPEPLPTELAGCLREKLLLWRFDDLHLASDVDLFATFALR